MSGLPPKFIGRDQTGKPVSSDRRRLTRQGSPSVTAVRPSVHLAMTQSSVNTPHSLPLLGAVSVDSLQQWLFFKTSQGCVI